MFSYSFFTSAGVGLYPQGRPMATSSVPGQSAVGGSSLQLIGGQEAVRQLSESIGTADNSSVFTPPIGPSPGRSATG